MKLARPARASAEEGGGGRLALGMAQMFLAGVAAVLLVETGPSAVTIGAMVLATSATLVSRWVYHRRRS